MEGSKLTMSNLKKLLLGLLEPFDVVAGALPLVSFCLLSDGLVGLVEGVL